MAQVSLQNAFTHEGREVLILLSCGADHDGAPSLVQALHAVDLSQRFARPHQQMEEEQVDASQSSDPSDTGRRDKSGQRSLFFLLPAKTN